MRAFDTNVLLRYLIGDEPDQAVLARQIVEDCRKSGEPVFVTVLVLCETIWVLNKVYRLPKSEIVAAVESVLSTDLFRFEHGRSVRLAFDEFRQSNADFADYLIGAISSAAGCRDTVTFDRALRGSHGFTLL